jgi:CHASE2 domain-containing sensor protein
MYGTFSREVASLRVKDLRGVGATRRRPKGPRARRRGLGARIVIAGLGAGSGVFVAAALPALGWIAAIALLVALIGLAAWTAGADSREPGGRDPFGRDRVGQG